MSLNFLSASTYALVGAAIGAAIGAAVATVVAIADGGLLDKEDNMD